MKTLRSLTKSLLSSNYTVSVDDGEETTKCTTVSEVLASANAVDLATLIVHYDNERIGSIAVMPYEADFVADYSVTPEHEVYFESLTNI